MKRFLVPILCILFLLICLVLLLHTGMDNPLVYSIEKESPKSLYHSDPEAQKRVDINTSTDVLPVMQDLLDFSGTITVSVRMKDLESTDNELSEYSQKLRSFNSLVVKLDMNQSELGTFNKNRQLQGTLYRQLANQSESLDALNKLEIRYRDEGNTEGLKSVMLQGDALKGKIQSIRNEYSNVSDNVVNQSKKIGLNTAKQEEAKKNVDEFVEDVAKLQSDREKNDSDLYADNQPMISFLVEPLNGTYRSVLRYNGFISGNGISNQTILIYLDNQTYIQTTSDNIGQFRVQKEIESVSSGKHTLKARWINKNSENQTINITQANTTLTLGLKAVKDRPIVNISGSFATNDSVVRYIPVDINVNNQTMISPVTDGRGLYKSNLTLPEGKYLVDATFTNSSYPLNVSESQLYEVVSSGSSIISIKLITGEADSPFKTLIPVIILVIVVAGGAGFGILVIRRRSKAGSDASAFSDLIDENNAQFNEEILSNEDEYYGIEDPGTNLYERYLEILTKQGFSEASHYVYLVLILLISRDTQIKFLNVMTPREVCGRIKAKKYLESFTSFAFLYEEIRYGGYEDEELRQKYENRMKIAEKEIRGDMK